MKYDISSILDSMGKLETNKLSSHELIALGKAISALGETKKEVEFAEEYLQIAALESAGGGMN